MNPLIRLYPRRWRDRYGDEFSALLDASPVGWRTAVDAARGALDAHRRTGGSPMRWLLAGSVLIAVDIVIGWLNYHASDDVQPVAAALIVAGFGFTFWRPRWAWLFIPALWVAIPISSVIADANNYHPGTPKPAPLYETAVALIPAALGALVGAVASWLVRQARA